MVSILDSIKQLLGIDVNDNNFDAELIIHINGALMILNQLGVGPEFYSITDKNNVWEEFTQGRKDLEIIKSFVYLKVRLMFDPPQNSFLVDSIGKQISEYEWRITVQTNKLVEVGRHYMNAINVHEAYVEANKLTDANHLKQILEFDVAFGFIF